MLGSDKPLKEIDSTSSSAADDRFEEILDRIESAGAEISEDQEAPLFIDLGNEEVEIGIQRTVTFNMNHKDFQITRSQKNSRVVGQDRRKSLEELSRPQIDIKLKMKPDTSTQWVYVDLENLF